MHYSFLELIHILTGVITFFVGPWQFIPWIRQHAVNLHRLMGKTYILCVMISSPTGLVISFKSDLALAAAGTAMQCVLWFLFTILAYKNIRSGNIVRHRCWMLRSYALVLAAPVLRLYIIILETLTKVNYETDFDFWYPLFVWFSFLPLGITEGIIRYRPVKKLTVR